MKTYRGTCRGITLLELLVGISLSVGVISLVNRAYINLYRLFMYNTQRLNLQQEFRLAVTQMERDLHHAGIFGSFSFHTRSAWRSYSTQSEIPAACSAEWCHYDPLTVGVKSYTADNAHILPPGAELMRGSEILRIQYGGDQVAYLDARERVSNCMPSANCTLVRCAQDGQVYIGQSYWINQGIESQVSSMMLVSSNRIYQLNLRSGSTLVASDGYTGAGELVSKFNSTTGCPNYGELSIRIESWQLARSRKISYRAEIPDMATLQMVNFYTRYYFTLQGNAAYESGLYVRSLLANGNLGAATMLASAVKQISFSFQVANPANQANHRLGNASNRYVQSNSEQLSGAEHGWADISAIIIHLSGVVANPLSVKQSAQSESLVASVGWLS